MPRRHELPKQYDDDDPATDREIAVFQGARLRERRKALSLSQETLGKKLEMTFQQVQKYEKGTNRISGPVLERLLHILQVPPAYFFPNGKNYEMPPLAPPLERRLCSIIDSMNQAVESTKLVLMEIQNSRH